MTVKRWDHYEHIPVEIEVRVHFTGYSDPGQLTGPAEKCYPPEGNDEREIESITIRDPKDPGCGDMGLSAGSVCIPVSARTGAPFGSLSVSDLIEALQKLFVDKAEIEHPDKNEPPDED